MAASGTTSSRRVAETPDHVAQIVGVRRDVEHRGLPVEFDRSRQDPVLVVLDRECRNGPQDLSVGVGRTDRRDVDRVRAGGDDAVARIDDLHDNVVSRQVREDERRVRQIEVLGDRFEVVGSL